MKDRNGNITAPFIDLNDALVRAKEVSSQYLGVINVTIHMFAGTHYLLKKRGDPIEIYTPTQFFDPYNINYQLTIKPLACNAAKNITGSICGAD